MALVVNPDMEYVKVEGKKAWVAGRAEHSYKFFVLYRKLRK